MLEIYCADCGQESGTAAGVEDAGRK